MEVLRFFEGIRNPFLDGIMSMITHFGEEIILIVFILVMFWCINKKDGYYLIIVGFLGIVLQQFLKLLFRIPRPWVIDKNFTIVESARKGATGYSFPSGHTLTAVSAYGGLFKITKYKWLKILSIILAILVPLSRMYLGVHTPLDVFASIIIAIILLVTLYPLTQNDKSSDKKMLIALISLVILSLFAYIFVSLYKFPENADMKNIIDGISNLSKISGASVGLLIAWYIENKYIKFETKAKWYIQVFKCLFGVLLILAIKEIIKAPLNNLVGINTGNFIRYFIVAITGVAIWPAIFTKFNKFLNKKEKN